jgi:hypothetical protein
VRSNMTLEALANEFADILDALPADRSIVDCVDYAAGAVFALVSVGQHKYWDRRGPFLRDYKLRVARCLREIAIHDHLNEYWLGGFFFYSAVQRIAALYDRLPRLLLRLPGTDRTNPHELFRRIYGADDHFPAWKQIYCEFNLLKHLPEGMSAGKKISIDDAIGALNEIARFFNERRSELQKSYSGEQEAAPSST